MINATCLEKTDHYTTGLNNNYAVGDNLSCIVNIGSLVIVYSYKIYLPGL